MIFGKFFSRKTPLLLVCLSGIMIFILLLSWGGYRFFLDNKISQLAWNESEVLSRSATVFSREMGHIKRVTLLLRNSVNARLTSKNQTAFSADWEELVVDEFSQFARTSSLISQVRWIMPNGLERVRINSQAGVITRVDDSQLQDKSDRNYIKNAPRATENDVYVSSLDLNIENKEIVRPFQPTVRGVVKITGDQSGFLVVNYDLSKLFELIRTFSTEEVSLEIVDAKGQWVLAADSSLEWGALLHSNDSRLNIKTHLPIIWQSMNATDGLERVFNNGRLWSFLKQNIDDVIGTQSEQVSSLYFVARSYSEAFSIWQGKLLLAIIGIAVFCFIAIAWLVWRQITAQFETYRLLTLLQEEKAQAEHANRKLNLTNKRLVDLQDELVETSKLSSLGMMVAGLAHEMHTPLGGVRMAMSSCKVWLDKEIGRSPSDGLDKMNDSLLIADKNLTRALDIVSSFKRIVSDRTAQDAQLFFFHNVLNDIVLTYKSTFKNRVGISLVIECPDDIEMIGYPGAMSQIIQNLFDNAFEYAFQRSAKGQITITASKEKENLIFSFEDSGNGISPDVLGSVFEPFITTGRQNNHTGLGLHLVNQWVYQLMKGHIEVTSEVGVGTKFIFTIPLKQSLEDGAT
ncbi:HAMP domain-containing sensor histidine kinase [Marinomonas sp. RSW2]|uniref:histidine kinase n=1 Tax=Marinomonas maritima TaxID=2940935 RepID=A0ABT5WJD6_9GAMM|nr:HAMP domain-containing sensor histidine kinase [Marinomonas maritima]MDE8604559.1 HAMP domain-containing sensor histidine kinase [Marinomonas maritima]